MLLEKLEEVKQAGNYSVTLIYGEDVGCDDLDVPKNERKLVIMASPVGVLGSVRTMWRGSLDTLGDFNPKSEPIRISNPPKYEEYNEDGFYVWGTEEGIKGFTEKFST